MQEWIKKEITAGIEKAFNFGFLGEPKNFTITAELWFDTLKTTCKDWTPERDAGRILKAFSEFFTIGKRFPLPANIIELLPPRKPQEALPRPEITDDERMTARKYIALLAFQSANSEFRALLNEAMQHKSENEKFIDVARRVLIENQDLKEIAKTFFNNYNANIVKGFD